MKHIPLSQGQFAIVDDEDFERISQWNWIAAWKKTTKSFYAQRSEYLGGGLYATKSTSHQMSRVILGLEKGDKVHVDHINRDTLDNRRGNLRMVTPLQNSWNRKTRADSILGIKGVCLMPSGRYQARIFHEGKVRSEGTFPTIQEASAAYFKAARELFGEYACDGRQIVRKRA